MSDIKSLKPKLIWKYFDEICTIPRPSKKEDKIIQYLIDFGKKHGLKTKKDHAGNVLISKPASPGYEKLMITVLQSHVDMVCEKNSNTKHNFEKDPIIPVVKGEWVKAKGTTLGADNGIGVAAQLAILSDKTIKHGHIECLFTVDEETGLTGAFELEPDFFQGKLLINLDSEDEGEIFIGCAGGIDTLIKFHFSKKAPKPNSIAYKITVKGLKGGHSGDDINKGRGNSNKILNRLLYLASDEYKMRLAEFNGGNLRNAIPREAYAVIVIPAYKKNNFPEFCQKFQQIIQKELYISDPDVEITCEKTDIPSFLINKKAQKHLINAIYGCPNGVMKMSPEIKGLVETSTNLASVKFTKDDKILISTSQRSSVESAKYDTANMVKSIFTLAGAEVWHSEGYPGWKPNPESRILQIVKESYKKVFSSNPKIKAIHAGLECGLFLKKYPDLDMVSIGPTIRDAHSPDEKLHIEDTMKFWKLLLEILVNIPFEIV
ncbi:MAG: aminoacyl-histidine dipeptidase [Bacteroidales bacterium]|nr:aminoacyl-histidine dipeptidase [Bacteroidales bacterium]